ncbi:MAG TPA: hypothetical protein VGC42_18765 [Kofleriaceae bacterium]
MSKASLRRLLSKLTALALSTSAAGPAAAAQAREAPVAELACDAVSCDLDFDASVPIDREHLDPQDAAIALGRSLALAMGPRGGMRRLSATHLAATWALSDDPLRKLAVGHALEWAFPLVGDDLVIDHLSHDGDPAIRATAARAAWTRRPTGGDLGVLARLSHDPDPQVRAIAGASRS